MWTGATLSVASNEWGDDWSILTDRVYGFVSKKVSNGYSSAAARVPTRG